MEKFFTVRQNKAFDATSRYLKTSFKYNSEWLLSLLLLICTSWLFLILALLIRRDGGPAFYAQIRIGKNNKPFRCYKFRTMVTNASDILQDHLTQDKSAQQEFENTYKLKDDPRITKLGKILRKYSLDELPQLYNVIRGEMSLIGPRPIVREERKYYGDAIKEYASVKPGITGLWQVSGRNDTSYEERVELDRRYVRNWSLCNDIVILIRTIFVVASARGAY